MKPDVANQKFIFNERDKNLGFPDSAPFLDAAKMLKKVDELKPDILRRESIAKEKALAEGYDSESVIGGATYEHIALTGIEGQLTEYLYGQPFARS
ncbi:MAG: hypothetical protein ABIR37_02855 [Candidatus Saccharimonadales bacterium]